MSAVQAATGWLGIWAEREQPGRAGFLLPAVQSYSDQAWRRTHPEELRARYQQRYARQRERYENDPEYRERVRAQYRAFGLRHRKRLSAQRKARYHTDHVWRERKRAYNREWLRNRQRRRKEHETADEEQAE